MLRYRMGMIAVRMATIDLNVLIAAVMLAVS